MCRLDSLQSINRPLRIFDFGLQEVKFVCLTSDMLMTLYVEVCQRLAYKNQVRSSQVYRDYGSQFNCNVRIKYPAKLVIDLASEKLTKV
jgi:hypothetical protein